jgi:hypothetical protein
LFHLARHANDHVILLELQRSRRLGRSALSITAFGMTGAANPDSGIHSAPISFEASAPCTLQRRRRRHRTIAAQNVAAIPTARERLVVHVNQQAFYLMS